MTGKDIRNIKNRLLATGDLSKAGCEDSKGSPPLRQDMNPLRGCLLRDEEWPFLTMRKRAALEERSDQAAPRHDYDVEMIGHVRSTVALEIIF